MFPASSWMLHADCVWHRVDFVVHSPDLPHVLLDKTDWKLPFGDLLVEGDPLMPEFGDSWHKYLDADAPPPCLGPPASIPGGGRRLVLVPGLYFRQHFSLPAETQTRTGRRSQAESGDHYPALFSPPSWVPGRTTGPDPTVHFPIPKRQCRSSLVLSLGGWGFDFILSRGVGNPLIEDPFLFLCVNDLG